MSIIGQIILGVGTHPLQEQLYLSFFLKAAVYKICKEIYCEGLEDVPFPDEDPDLIGDR